MAALNFPDSPSNGDEFSGYVYDSAKGVWNRLPTLPALDLVNFSAAAPSNPQDGQFWFDTTAGKMYVYYNDGSSAQWVSTLGGLVGQTGTEGQQLIHNGTEWVAHDGGSRNLLYNGAMQVAQRGTSATGITVGGYLTADRWRTDVTNMGTWTQTVEADGPTGSGFTRSLKMECTTADGSPAAADFVNVQQRLEGQDLQGLKKGTSSAESLTFSFYVKSNVTGTYIVEFLDLDNSRHIAAAYTIDSSGTWEQKSITLPGDTGGSGFANDNGLSFLPIFWLGAGSDRTSGTLATSWAARNNANGAVGQTNLAASIGNYWQITGVQLETGTIATLFEHKSYATELAECQRYYWRSVYESGTTRPPFGYGHTDTETKGYATLEHPVEMRTVVTGFGFSNLEMGRYGVDSYDVSNVVISRGTRKATTVQVTTSQNMPINGAFMYLTGNGTGDSSVYVELEAEL